MASSTSTPPPETPQSYPMENSYNYQHGGINPGVEENIDLVESIPLDKTQDKEVHQRNSFAGFPEDEHETRARKRQALQTGSCTSLPSKECCFILDLPSELIDYILSYLDPLGLVAVSGTCHSLLDHAKADVSWQRHIQENVPGIHLKSPYPCKSFRELYIAHDPHWFIPKYKIWFNDYFLTGKFIIARYDQRRGVIEGYRLVAEREAPTFEPWEVDDNVLIHSFDPTCRLHLDQPILQLDVPSHKTLETSYFSQTQSGNRFSGEIPMRIEERSHRGVFSNFSLARPVEEPAEMQLWPPPTVPARHRAQSITGSSGGFVGEGHRPQKRSEVSNQTFRIRRWMQMMTGPNSPGLHLGEEVHTYSTLDPKLYTPTEEKPYRGIWIGDYSGHGCEFLLMHQPDNEEPFDEASVPQREGETAEDWRIRKKQARINRGSLKAIKLTGDPNIPRGEYTWIADDISDASLVRVAHEDRFKGARVVTSRGHIASRMFRNDKYIETQMIMISHNRLAQYWVGFGHISFYKRVNIDDFLSPDNDSIPKPGR